MSESVSEIGVRLVALCREGRNLEAIDRLYDEKIVSIEAQGTEELPARMEGIEAIRGKNRWWFDNHEVHSSKTEGPFCGHRNDQFAVLFDTEVTQKGSGQRMRLTEVALFTVAGGKIVTEEFLYSAG